MKIHSSYNQPHLHPYLLMERQVHDECWTEKEKLKTDLQVEVTNLAREKSYSLIEAKIEVTSLIKKKLEAATQRMENETNDVERKQMIRSTLHAMAAELYSPSKFKKVLENILMRESFT